MKKKSLALFLLQMLEELSNFSISQQIFPNLTNIRNFFFFKGDSKYLLKNSIFNNNLNFDLVICATSMNDYEKGY